MAQKTDFTNVVERPNFPEEEVRILKYWEQINAFHKQLELTKDCPRFTFYDGPPFATGLPHYGHMCAGTIKDVVCRYFAMNGRYVERRFGWDCHGLPVEHEIDKTLNIQHRGDILKMGIDKYNHECRSIVMRYASEWRRIIGRTGRWIDFDNDYKTLDTSFMESVWWVFKQMWEKGLVYRGCKVMPYSNGCSTVLSNFETQQNYKNVWDPAIVVTFPQVNDETTKFVAWTTTPWTLPSNLALAVHPDFDYVKLLDKASNTHYILAESRIVELYNDAKLYEVVQKFKGSELVGTEYVPLFNYFPERREQGCYRVLAANFVTSDDGTGIVHCAPGFGDDDYKTCLKAGIITPSDPLVPIDSSGRFLESVKDFSGMQVKEADKEIRKTLKNNGRLIKDGQVQHNYPYCWRSQTPLIYKAVNCWFIKVTAIKDKLVVNNKKARWVPQSIQDGRFNNWLDDAQDWCFSRNRFWGNPIPIWVSDDFEESVCIGSIEELRQLSGVENITDLHREYIDHITIPSKQGKGVLRRIEEVFDCWFESGSMPFAQQHYPFERKELFENIFPADFIAEGLDQTRGWFYTLNVIATALRDDTPYKNLIVNGIVLNEKGEKMSKSKKNYPDPEVEIINQYGADAMRLYLINSGLVKAQPLNFSKDGVQEVIKNVFLPWYNAYRFLIQNLQRYESIQGKFLFDENAITKGDNTMDKWIVSSSQTLVEFVRNEMEAYRLYTIVPRLVSYLDTLTNWYVRLNRSRIKGDQGHQEWVVSLNVLFDVLLKITLLMSPYVPFITESFYQNLKKCIPQGKMNQESIHFLQIPEVRKELIDPKIESQVEKMQIVVESARKLREAHKLSLKQPVNSLTILATDEQLLQSVQFLSKYIEEEINTPSVLVEKNIEQYIQLKAEPDNKICGQELKDKFGPDLIQQVRNFTQEQIRTLKTEGKLQLKVKVKKEKKVEEQVQQQPDPKAKKGKKNVEYIEVEMDCELLLKHVKITDQFNTEKHKQLLFATEEGFSIILDPSQTQELKNLGLAREFTNRIQKLRKKLGLQLEDKILIFYQFEAESELSNAVQSGITWIKNQIKKPIYSSDQKHQFLNVIGKEDTDVDNHKFSIVITKYSPIFNKQKLLESYNEKEVDTIIRTLLILPNLQQNIEFTMDGKKVTLGPEHYTVPQ
ncbi:unnamed protein product [Paramecium pentaurelia]|uniref:isoleucine--tRNA ligase n=1 Tax=Paramecium pentaurelia TaxID=43138 RepID=A0A8S1UBE6_9CILI|nr:unnamed protein product [Paramecium pentaurelia]